MREQLLAELCGLGHLVRGTVVDTLRKCGRPDCSCAIGERHPFTYLSTSGKKGNRIVYVRKAERASFEAGCAAYRRAWEIIETLSALNINSIKQKPGRLRGKSMRKDLLKRSKPVAHLGTQDS